MGQWLHSLWGVVDWTLIGRLILTLLLCAVIGLERSTHERSSGFRPHILVGLGACLMTLVGAYGFADIKVISPAPLQLAGYVISGIGFLGAGAILQHGTTVRGITTAASLWAAAGVGITVAVGLGGLALVATALILFTLSPLSRLEAHLRWGDRTGQLTLHLSNDQRAVGKALAALQRLGVPMRRATILPGAGTSALLRVELDRDLGSNQVPLLIQRLLTLKYVQRVDHSAGLVDHDMPSDDQNQETSGNAPVLNFTDDLHDLQDVGDATPRAEPQEP